MKNSFRFLVGLVLIPILLVFLAYYLNQEKIDIRYTLSEKIPVQNLSENIQQLEIKNNGNALASKLLIKINKNIKEYNLFKYSKMDSVKASKDIDYFELLYYELPPEGKFKIVLNTLGEGINISDLEISHTKGKAKEALEKRGIIIWEFAFLPLFLFYLLICLEGIRKLNIYNLESDARNYKQEKLLTRKKPFYVNVEKWKSIRELALENLFEKENFYFHNIQDNNIYKFLSSQKPEYIEENEWVFLLDKLSKKFYENISFIIGEFKYSVNVEQLLSLSKPSNFPENKWDEIVEKLNEKFILLKKLELSNYISLENILKEFKFGKPKGINEKYWVEYLKFLKEHYFLKLSLKLEYKADPIKFINEQDLDVLNDEDIDRIKTRAYQLQIDNLPNVINPDYAEEFLKSDNLEWMSDSDYKLYENKAKDSIELDRLHRKNNITFDILNSIIKNEEIIEKKPDELSAEEWKNIQKIEDEIITLSEINKTEAKENSIQKEHVQSLINRVEKQLDIINIFLNDPGVIDRIEEYSNVFATGNFNNLRKLAKILKDNKIV